MFLISSAECVHQLATGRNRWADRVSLMLHALMGVAMTVMAWPAGAGLPTTGPMLVFAAAAAWFLIRTLADRGHRARNAYHGVMMLAMAWMYAVMGGGLAPTPADGGTSAIGHAAHHGPAAAATGAQHGDPPLITGLDWAFAVGFAVAALWWFARPALRRSAGVGASWRVGANDICQAMMAAGMAVMFKVML
ncbi:DUF5134 domain-containing protein [Mycolicibacterium brumae]|nr:DUF5134 domain-containing protein [Mycolicibacterium brumae]